MTQRRRVLDFRALRRSSGLLLLVLFLLVDIGLVALHLLVGVGASGLPHYHLGVDRSYSEAVIYIKLGWITVLALLLARRRHTPVFAALALGSLLLLIEDAFTLHEQIGWHLNGWVLATFPALGTFGLLSFQVGELLWLGALGTVILGMFVVGYVRADARDRCDALSIAVFFGIVAFFAVVVDTIHSFSAPGSLSDAILTLVEDGGELIALSPAVALAFALAAESESDAAVGKGPGSGDHDAENRHHSRLRGNTL